jgi:hypothetical protein
MTSPVWITPSGFLGTLTQLRSTSTAVFATGTGISYSIISGEVPQGIYLNSSTGIISGTPVSVSVETLSTFVTRASNTHGIKDRSFSLLVTGSNLPNWITTNGLLPVGLNGEYYTINLEYVDFQLRAENILLTGGNSLKYYIADGKGTLPPGLTLTPSGRIYGIVADQLQLDWEVSESGGYDDERYDQYPYDHAMVSNVTTAFIPKAVNRLYQFQVTVTDGVQGIDRLFGIEVVDPANLGEGLIPQPIWLDPYGGRLSKTANLGTVRANRPLVIELNEYDPYPYSGPLVWNWERTVNPEIRLITDSKNSTKNLQGSTSIYFNNTVIFPIVGMAVQLNLYVDGFNSTTYQITGVVKTGDTEGFINIDKPLFGTIPNNLMIFVGSLSVHPPGISLDTSSGVLYGQIPYQPSYSIDYKFTVDLNKTDTASSSSSVTPQIFLLRIKGDIDSYIQFVSTGSLGTLMPGQISELSVIAKNVNSEYSVQYSLIGGDLPSGLTLLPDGNIQGKINYNSQTIFDFSSTNSLSSLMMDGGTTTVDKNWKFTVRASDVYRSNLIDQEFSITILENSRTEYTRMFVKPFMPVNKRAIYEEFINDSTIFDPSLLYRPNDLEFGSQREIKMLLETGIQKLSLDDYSPALNSYFYRKKFYFGEVKSVNATDNLGNIIYELVYIDIIDDQMIGTYSPSTVNSLGNIQFQLESIMISDENISTDEALRPRYMNTLKPNGVPLGFIKAVVLCYALPGNSAKIISRIKSSKFNFLQFNFDTDRIIVETPLNSDQSGWLFYPTER